MTSQAMLLCYALLEKIESMEATIEELRGVRNIEKLAYEANKAFYAWETKSFGDNSPISDDGRLLWVAGFMAGGQNASD